MLRRIRSDFWVSAYLRLRSSQGLIAVLRRRGHAEAGSIWVKLDRLDGTAVLYGPAPPAEDDDGDRRFTVVMQADPAAIEERMRREIGYDEDLWLLEVEDSKGVPGFDVV